MFKDAVFSVDGTSEHLHDIFPYVSNFVECLSKLYGFLFNVFYGSNLAFTTETADAITTRTCMHT